jgi:hypothetical protein
MEHTVIFTAKKHLVDQTDSRSHMKMAYYLTKLEAILFVLVAVTSAVIPRSTKHAVCFEREESNKSGEHCILPKILSDTNSDIRRSATLQHN